MSNEIACIKYSFRFYKFRGILPINQLKSAYILSLLKKHVFLFLHNNNLDLELCSINFETHHPVFSFKKACMILDYLKRQLYTYKMLSKIVKTLFWNERKIIKSSWSVKCWYSKLAAKKLIRTITATILIPRNLIHRI